MAGEDLAGRVTQTIEARAGGQAKTMDQWIQTYGAEFETALPSYVDPDRFLRLALNELRWSPELRDCDPFSVIGALMTCAQLGLEPSGPLNHVFLIPRWHTQRDAHGNEQRTRRVQLIVGYQGYIELALRTGAVRKLVADVVREQDDFDLWLEDGTQRIRHRPPPLGRDRGPLIGAYAVAAMVDGDVIARAVDMTEIHRARSSSEAAMRNKGPWVTDFDAMAMKTAVRRLWKWLPKTPAAAAGYVLDESTVTEPDLELDARAQPLLDVVEAETVDATEPEEPTGDDPERPFTEEPALDAHEESQ